MTPTRTLAAELDTEPFSGSPLIAKTFGEPRFHTEADIAAVAFAADGTLWSVDESGLLRHWSAEGQSLQRSYLSDLETLWCFNAEADLLASGNDDLLIWSTAEAQLLYRIPQPGWVSALAFSPDGRTVACGHDDGYVRLWDVRSQRQVGELPAHADAVSAIQFSALGDRIATAGEDRVVQVWNAESHKLLATLKSHTDRIPALAWAPDGSLLVSAGWDTSARVWRPGTSTEPAMLLNSHADQVLCVAFSGDGKLLATADSENDIYLWSNAASGKVRHALRGHAGEVRSLSFNRDGSILASAGTDRVVHLWDTRDGKLLAGPNPTGKHGLALVVGSNPLLASTGGPTLRVWALATGDEVRPSGDGPAFSVAASDTGRWLAVGGTDHRTRLYDLSQPEKSAKILEATKPPVGALAFAPGGQFLVQTSPADGLAWIWKPEGTEAELILIEAADGCTLETVAVHPDGNRVAVGGIDYLSTGERDGAVCIWDITTKLKLATFDTGVYALAFDPQGRFLVGAGLADHIHVWDLAKDEEIFALEGHQEQINAVAFSPDGNYLLSGGDDQTVRVWDVLSGRLLVVREFDTSIQGLAFSADGQTLFTSNGNTTCYQLEFKKLLED